MTTLLDQLKSMTAIVADTGDIEAIRRHLPEDATTNPSLLLKAASLPEYAPLIEDAISWAKAQSNDRTRQVGDAMDKLAVDVGIEVLKIVPGRIFHRGGCALVIRYPGDTGEGRAN
jgi:transaldolase